MATAQFNKLPREIRDEIWAFALLPEPAVYRFDPDWFKPNQGDVDGFEDERWIVPKRPYPTAMHLCHESREFALRLKAQEQKEEQENGKAPYYCFGDNARLFNPATDTFWFNKGSLLDHPYLINLASVIGRGIHTIENLAFSPDCLTIPLPGSNPRPSRWNSFRWHRLVLFVSLKRVDIVLAEKFVRGNDAQTINNTASSDLEKEAELRLEKWMESSSLETANEVETQLEMVRASILQVFQETCRRLIEEDIAELLYLLPEGAPDWHDGSRITFHAAQVAIYKKKR